MFWKKPKPNTEQLERIAQEGAALRELWNHPAFPVVEKRLQEELAWVRSEWSALLEKDEPELFYKQHELYSYLRALQLVQHILFALPKSGWKAEDKLLAFAERGK